MRITYCFISLCMLLVSACGGDNSRPSANPAPGHQAVSELSRDTQPNPDADLFQSQVAANNGFAWRLYHQLRQSESGNLFYSPFSIDMALAMVYAGARGDTAAEIQTALNFTVPDADLHKVFNELDLVISKVDEENNFRFANANALYVQDGYPVKTDFLDVLGVNYGSAVNMVDFVAAPDTTRVQINDWVSDQTEQRINDLFPQGSITDLTRFVLVNAVYFLGDWQIPFNPDLTDEGDFYNSDDQPQSVAKMHMENDLLYYATDQYVAVELLYKNTDYAMVIIMPSAGQIATVESEIGNVLLQEIRDNIQSTRIDLSMPKWEYSSGSINMVPLFNALGMETPFTDGADFSGISNTGDLRITGIFHKAFVKVDEKGTEAAAATGVVGGVTSVPPPAIPVDINRPFIFLIHHKASGQMLFMGRVSEL